MKGIALSIIIITLLLVANVSAEYYNLEIKQEKNKALINESFGTNNNLFNNTLPEENIDNSGSNYYFTYRVIPQVQNNISIRMILSEGFGVKEEDIYPKNFILQTDGYRVIITWHFDKLENSKDIPIFVKFNHVNNISTILTIIAIILTLLIITFAILFIKNKFVKKRINNKNRKKFKKKEDYTSYLADGEKRVIEILRKSNSELWQKDIQKESDFSKAKLSRIIRNLETKNIISRTPIGNTNRIKIKKK